MTVKSFQYGRMLEDFQEGATYEHPWDVTVDGGMVALFQASFLDTTPVYASSTYARDLGLRERPLHPLLLLNLGLSFSVHDVSEQAIAHLAYLDVRFPEAAYPGDTMTASSKVIAAKKTSTGDRGVVHVRTLLVNQQDKVVCAFERKALVRAGGPLANRPASPHPAPAQRAPDTHRLPPEMREHLMLPKRKGGFFGYAQDFAAGDVFAHDIGRTISEAEHMQLTFLVRNSHPLHYDELYCKAGASFAKTRVIYGGLVFGWIASLASRDTCGNVLWDMGFDNGAHPSGVVAGDTLFAASKVLAVKPHDGHTSEVTFRLVGVKNVLPSELLASGADLFTPELAKKVETDKTKSKVFEIDRTVLMPNHA